jgi:hypothetical protein
MRIKNNKLADQLKALVSSGDLPAPAQKPPLRKEFRSGPNPASSSKKLIPRKNRKAGSGFSSKKPKINILAPPPYNGPLLRPPRQRPTPTVTAGQVFTVTDAEEIPENRCAWAKQTVNKSCIAIDCSGGEAFQLSPAGQDTLTEVVLGIDFGTSSTKVILRDTDREMSYAVKFKTENDQFVQILPTAVYLDGDNFSLQRLGRRIDNIKIKALRTVSNRRALATAISYLALVIRYSRSYLLNRYRNVFSNRDLLWRFHFGIPAADIRDFPTHQRYLAITRDAVLCSVGSSNHISVNECLGALDKCGSDQDLSTAFSVFPRALRHACDNSVEFFSREAVKVWPEVMAQTHGFLRSNLWNPQTMSRVMTIDVGAGTLDVSLCQISNPVDDDFEFAFTPLFVSVDGLGLRNFVRNRRERILASTADFLLKESLRLEFEIFDEIDWVGVRVPTPLLGNNGFVNGIYTIGDPTDVDKGFITQIGKMVYSNSAQPAFSDRVYSEKPMLPVFLCGGGKFVDFYRRRILFYAENQTQRVVFAPQELRSPEELIDTEDEIFDRVSVAYGLAFSDLGKFVDDGFGRPSSVNAFSVPSVQRDWADRFVDKDMV